MGVFTMELISGWEWDSDEQELAKMEQDEGCDEDFGEEEESFYADSTTYMKDTPKQVPKALQAHQGHHHPPGGRLAPTQDDFQVREMLA